MRIIRRLRAKALERAGKMLDRLNNKGKTAKTRILYNTIRFIWETISPSKVFRVVSARQYIAENGGSIKTVKANRTGYAAKADIIGRGDRGVLQEYSMPDLYFFEVKDVCVHHGSDHIIDIHQNIVINDYCANKTDSNQGYEDKVTYYQTGKIAILKNREKKEVISSGIMINGKFSYNYYHNLYENLIKLLVVEENNDQISKEVPIIVDEDVFKIPSVKRIYEILSEKINRKVVVLKSGELLFVKHLYSISSINMLAPVLYDLTKGKITDCIFDKEYTQKLRERLLEYEEKGSYPERVFISRKNTKHRNFNEDEVFNVLEPLGFVKVAPEELSFEQQMALFHNSKWIVGGPGAAFTNLLFTSSCVAICLYEETRYIPAVFSAPAYFNNTRLVYFLSGEERKQLTTHKGNFTVDVDSFRQFAKDCITPQKK